MKLNEFLSSSRSGESPRAVPQRDRSVSQAELLCRRALKGCERHLGARHAETVKSLTALAILLEEKGDTEEARDGDFGEVGLEGVEKMEGVKKNIFSEGLWGEKKERKE